ncbi:MAG: dienelactone hydrolase family protein [Alphaproteobacteria bacterium]|nr:dienelactone hydrolase family protein [Alphaproteobacteria bacterium]
MLNDYAHSTIVTGADAENAKVICIFVHGRTQSPADMMQQVITHLDAADTRFILPKSAGDAWYNARAVDPLTVEARSELGASLDIVAEVIGLATQQSPNAKLVLAGFSQGSCLLAEYILLNGKWDGAACLFTGCRVGVEADNLPASDLTDMPIYISCGDKDPWIPAASYNDLGLTFIECGVRLKTEVFPGRDHSVTASECAALNGMLNNLAANIPVFDVAKNGGMG